MNPEPESKPESSESEADKMARLLELELAQKRAAWNKAGDRYKKMRTASLVFMFLLVIGTLFAFFLLLTTLNERRGEHGPAPAPAASP